MSKTGRDDIVLPMQLLTAFLLCFSFSALLVPVAIHYLLHRDIMDAPRVQSSHEGLTPRGGGIGVIPVILVGWIWLLANNSTMWPTHASWIAALIGLVMVCYISWRDDIHESGLRVRTRLAIQILAVGLPLIFWPLQMGHVLPEYIPDWIERFLLVFGWLWYLNLFNFMDGINGITGMQAMSICLGIVALTVTGAIIVPPGIATAAVMVAGAAGGFLIWNARTQAKVFLGDVGSIGLGYCIAWLLITVAAQNYLIVGLLLTMVYLADATFTIVKRGLQGKKIWKPHREHCYHMATVKGALGHLQTVGIILTMNVVLLVLAFAAAHHWLHPFICLGIGLVLVTIMLRCFWLVGLRAQAKEREIQPNL